jgi:transcriptional regulator with XRE-family HTH domain
MLQKPEELRQERFLEHVNGLNVRFPNKQIVEKTGYKSGIVSEYLNGKKIVSESFLKVYCEKFGADYDYIMGNKPAPAGDKLNPGRALVKALVYQAAKGLVELDDLRMEIEDLRAELNSIKTKKRKVDVKGVREPLSFREAIEEIRKITNLVQSMELDLDGI